MKDGATHSQEESHPRRKNFKALVAIGGGQAVENYDWLLYGLMSAYFGPQIFPSDSEVTSTLSALAVFGVAFVARPLGAVVLGPIADRLGRKPMMMYSVAGIAGSSILIGFLPTSEGLGPFSGILLVVLRMIQGLSMGVEAPLFAAYALEVAPKGREAWYAGTLQAFSQFGLLLASTAAFASSLILGGEQMSEWGWRVPFIIGGLIGLFVIWMRRGLPESLHSDEAKEEPQQSSKEVLRNSGKSKLAICTIILVVGGAQVLNYGWVAGVPSAAASVLGEDATLIFGLTSAMTLGVLIMSPIAGQIADRYGVGRTFVWSRWLSIPFVFTLVILFMWPTGGRLALVMAAGIVLLAFAMGIFNAVTSSLVPQVSRVTSVGIGHSIGVAVFGGTASYILVWLASVGVIWVFPIYVAALLAASAILYRINYKLNGIHDVVYTKSEPSTKLIRQADHHTGSL